MASYFLVVLLSVLFVKFNRMIVSGQEGLNLGLWLAVQDGKVRLFPSPLALVSYSRKRRRGRIGAREFGRVSERRALEEVNRQSSLRPLLALARPNSSALFPTSACFLLGRLPGRLIQGWPGNEGWLTTQDNLLLSAKRVFLNFSISKSYFNQVCSVKMETSFLVLCIFCSLLCLSSASITKALKWFNSWMQMT